MSNRTMFAVWRKRLDTRSRYLERAGQQTIMRSSRDVARFVDRLQRWGDGAARIYHLARRPRDSGDHPTYDHCLVVGFQAEFGYLAYTDFDVGYWVSSGDAGSPRYRGRCVDFPAGTGTATATVRDALDAFLTEPERPACVEWRRFGIDE